MNISNSTREDDIARPIERRLQIILATMVTLGTLMLGMGQRDMTLPIVAVIAAGLSLYFTDIAGLFHLNRLVANLAALAAVGLSAYQFFHHPREQQLFAVANLLIYLQLVMMFQQKHLRLYPQIMMLSWLQAVVAAALSLTVYFAALLLVYLVLALAAFGMLYVLREAQRWKTSQTAATPANSVANLPLAQSEQASLLDVARRGLLARRVAWQLVFSVCVGVMVFVIVPRSGRAGLQASFLAAKSTVGFNENVTLGSMHELISDPEVAMYVRFQDPVTHAAYRISGEPLLRGSLQFDYQNGKWRNPYPPTVFNSTPGAYRTSADPVLQQVAIEPMDHDILFSIYPPRAPGGAGLLDSNRHCLVRRREDRGRRYNYEVGTAGFRGGKQRLLLPNVEGDQDDHLDQLRQMPLFTPDRGDPLAGLRATAQRWLDEAKIPPGDWFSICKTLESKLASAPYTYTLSPPKRNASIDPIEDFVTQHQQGHCEYFATALALMLRSRGIPARLVVGYRGGEFNEMGSFYQVRQMDAHAWVEAYLEPDRVPIGETHRDDNFREGGWLTLDATPAANIDSKLSTNALWSSIRGLSDYLQLAWSEYVVGLNAERQNEAIFKPLSEKVHSAGVFDSGGWQRWWNALMGGKHGEDEQSGSDPPASNVPLGAVLLLLIAVALIVKLIQRFGRRLPFTWHRIKSSPRAETRSASTAWFRRFDRLLAAQGLRRLPTQTRREFAQMAARRLALSDRESELHQALQTLVDAYYQVRFGGQMLNPQQQRAVDQAFRQLQVRLPRRSLWQTLFGMGDRHSTATTSAAS